MGPVRTKITASHRASPTAAQDVTGRGTLAHVAPAGSFPIDIPRLRLPLRSEESPDTLGRFNFFRELRVSR
jgi:hypothetical protein